MEAKYIVKELIKTKRTIKTICFNCQSVYIIEPKMFENLKPTYCPTCWSPLGYLINNEKESS